MKHTAFKNIALDGTGALSRTLETETVTTPRPLIKPTVRRSGWGESQRLDHRLIGDIIEPGSTVLDLGCGNGDLLALLKDRKQVRGQGIEVDESAIYHCVEKGLAVFHLDFDAGLAGFPDNSFDYVILNRSLQETVHVQLVLNEAMRVGKRVIVGFPNFAHYKVRCRLFFRGATPVTESLPHLWYNTPNLHFLSISDFYAYVRDREIQILEKHYFTRKHIVRFRPNLFAVNGLFVIRAV
ncbi:MAG: methionine biosynthesis protein MetW [bacterium]|nr:methionine biosynthesis protein MetW [bacterium]